MRIILILLLAVSVNAYGEPKVPSVKEVPDIRSELKRLSTAEPKSQLSEIASINRLPPTSAGVTPSHNCQFARGVLEGKELQFQELQTVFYTKEEYFSAINAIKHWSAQVDLACKP